MRKKIIALLLLSSALLSLCACKKGDGENAAESVYSDPTYFNGTTTVKVSDEAAVAALTSGEMEVQTSEDGPFVTIKLGTTAEKFTPLVPEGEMQYLERKGYAEYLPVGSQIFVSLDAPEEGAVAISQYGDVFQFSPTITTKEQIRKVMGEPKYDGSVADVCSESLIYGTSEASCLAYEKDGNQLWFIFTADDIFQSTVMCKAGKFIFND